ncbi:hypothetical protein GPX89_26355 [Nocardia sp. ET3-3]|uniref:Uncharacterized protein n=1 Tax=Nocardia terrae TaxID=2675851 RepID=A0A7K1V2N7_9NOCA|nr:hypothetical protein [Nocardia terrae]MVU80762.1 hypothetical protein [Nocardia terrae]
MARFIPSVAIPFAAILVAAEAYRRYRRTQLVLMPTGINDARGVTMRSSIKAADPTYVNR